MLKEVADVESIETVPFEVSAVVSPILDDLREKLDAVDPKKPGQQRYEAARELGCGAAIAKGAKYRSLLPEQIYVPNTEIRRANGTIRIPYLKTAIPEVPSDVVVKAVVYIRKEGAWVGQLEVKKLVL